MRPRSHTGRTFDSFTPAGPSRYPPPPPFPDEMSCSMVGLCLQGPRWSYQCSAPVDSVSLSSSASALSNRVCSVRHLVGQRGRQGGTSSCRPRGRSEAVLPRTPFARPPLVNAAGRRRSPGGADAPQAGCGAPANEIVAENCLPGDTDWGISGSGSPQYSGLRHRHQREPRPARWASRSTRPRQTTSSTSTGWVTTTATGRARSRRSSRP